MKPIQFETGPAYIGDSVSMALGAWTLTAKMKHDSGMEAPWKEHDGHGFVSEWTRRDKAPGEMVLASDGSSKRYYDFAGACAKALVEGWGISDEERAKLEAPRRVAVKSEYHVANGIRQDRITEWREEPGRPLTKRQIASIAALNDYKHLKAWCDDEWQWSGVVVSVEANGHEIGSASLWGIESDCGSYALAVANELIDEALDDARATVAA